MLKGLSLHRKLAALVVIVSSATLVMASVAYVAWDFVRFRAQMRLDTATRAGLVLDNTAAAISFRDPQAARETLDMLSIDRHTKQACLYLPTGELFASVRFRDQPHEPDCQSTAPAPGYAFANGHLYLTERLTRGPDIGATLFLSSDLEAEDARLREESLAVSVVLILGLLLSFALSAVLQRIVSKPIERLSNTARDIAHQRDFTLRAANADTGDEIAALVTTFNDMLDEIQRSQHERADLLLREQEANRLKDEFLATLSHELRTPLNANVGWTPLLRTTTVPPDQFSHALERIDRNAKAQARLVQDLLDVSRITTGKLRLDPREMDLNAVITNAVDACRPAADARQIAVTLRFQQPEAKTVGDPDRLQQVVWNLVSNAVRFTPAGGQVIVSSSRDRDSDIISVTDNGSGIDAAFLPHVFEPFRQADAASTRTHGGLGLGLNIVRRLTEMHGGVVEARSEGIGQGATFTVRLPVRRLERLPGLDPSDAHSKSALRNAVILLVDDDEDTLAVMDAALKSHGAITLPAASAAEALRLVDAYLPDAIVSDIAMPGEDGYTLMTLLKHRLGAAMPAVAVAVTAYASERDRSRAMSAGYNLHLSKPLDPDVLLESLSELIQAAQPLRPLR